MSWFFITKVVVEIVVVNAFPFLPLPSSIASQANKFFLPQLHQSIWCLAWEIALDTATCFVTFWQHFLEEKSVCHVTYGVWEEEPVGLCSVKGVNPRVAVKMDDDVARNLESGRLKEKLVFVLVCYGKRSWNSKICCDMKFYVKSCDLHPRMLGSLPVSEFCHLTHLPFSSVCYTKLRKESERDCISITIWWNPSLIYELFVFY